MATMYRAATRIKHGMKDGSAKEFAVGEKVEGLSEDEMKELWLAGALEEFEGDASLGTADADADADAQDLTAEVRDSVDGDEGAPEPKETGTAASPVELAEAKPKAASAKAPATSTKGDTTKTGTATSKSE